MHTEMIRQNPLTNHILHFCRALRYAGVPVGIGAVIDAMSAVAATGIREGDDFRNALHAVLVKNPGKSRVFDQAFYALFRNPQLLEKLMSIMLPAIHCASTDLVPDKEIRRRIESVARDSVPGTVDFATDTDRSGAYSAMEVFRRKDFARMNPVEVDEALQLLRETVNDRCWTATRRFRASADGRHYDLRRSIRLMLRSDGEPIQLARRRRQYCPPRLVLLCDVSGSMSAYSRMFLHYAHLLSMQNRTVQTFVFGTRLTNISPWLRDRDTGRAMRRVSAKVPDWDGGTRIADCLKKFNMHWARRVLSGNARVVLLCDGLERDSHSRLGFEMRRLRQSCRELIWMNPMLRFEGFRARASGIRAMLPHVDRFVAAHNIASMTELGRMLASASSRRVIPGTGIPA